MARFLARLRDFPQEIQPSHLNLQTNLNGMCVAIIAHIRAWDECADFALQGQLLRDRAMVS